MADITYQQVIELVRTLPAERLGSLYDYARFLKEQSSGVVVADIFGESEEEIAADEAWWDEQFAQSEDTLLRLAEQAEEEYRAGETTPMEFNDKGRLQR